MSVAAPTVAPERGEEGWGVLVYFTVGLASVLVATTSLGLFLPDIIDDLDLSPAEQGWAWVVLAAGERSFLDTNELVGVEVQALEDGRCRVLSGIRTDRHGGRGTGVRSPAAGPDRLGMVLQACQSPRNILIIQWISKRRFGLANGFSISIADILMGTGTVLIPFMLGWLGGWRQRCSCGPV